MDKDKKTGMEWACYQNDRHQVSRNNPQRKTTRDWKTAQKMERQLEVNNNNNQNSGKKSPDKTGDSPYSSGRREEHKIDLKQFII